MSNPEPIQVPGREPLATISLVDQFSRLRAAYLVGQCLAEMYPTAAAWDQATHSREFLELVAQVADALQRVRRQLPTLDPNADPQQVQAAVAGHYQDVLEVVGDLASFLAVDAEDLLSFLVAN